MRKHMVTCTELWRCWISISLLLSKKSMKGKACLSHVIQFNTILTLLLSITGIKKKKTWVLIRVERTREIERGIPETWLAEEGSLNFAGEKCSRRWSWWTREKKERKEGRKKKGFGDGFVQKVLEMGFEPTLLLQMHFRHEGINRFLNYYRI